MPSSYAQLYIHLVWATWDRLPVLKGEVRDTAYACIRAECKELGVRVIALGGTDDHVHLFGSLPTTLAVADLAKRVKGASSHLVSHTVPGADGFKWQGSYAAFSVSKSMGPTVREYIRNQEEHHAARTTDKDAELAWEEREMEP